jgi:Mrp family chromosome partitioning ATPase
MSALDQAFIKAYAKDGPQAAAAASIVATSPALPGNATKGAAPARRMLRDESMGEAQAIERMYHEAVLYRVDAPRTSTTRRAAVPSPHFQLLPPTSPKRNVRRSMLQLLGRAGQQTTPMPTAPPPRPTRATGQLPAAPPASRPNRTLAEIADELAPLPVPPQSPVQRPTDPPVRRATRVELPPEIIIDAPRTKEPAPASLPAEPKLPAAPPILPAIAPPNVAPLNLAKEFAPQFEVHGHWEAALVATPGSLVITPEPADLYLAEPAPLVELKLDALPERGSPVRPAEELQDVAASPIPSFRVDPPHALAAAKPHAKYQPSAETPTESASISEQTANDPQAYFGDAADEPAAQEIEISPAALAAAAELNFAEQETAIEPDPSEAAASANQQPAAAAIATGAATVAECVPLWEVDRLQWPTTVERLVADKDGYFAHASGRLLAAVRDGLRTLAISGSRRGEGRTTLALALARAAAKAGIQVAVIDADFARPQLGARVGLEIHHGWQDAATGLVPLSETAIRALADNVTVLPLEATAARTGLSLADPRVTATLRAAAATFELVLVDLGPLGASDELLFPAEEACPLDAAIVVRDLRYASAAESEDIGQRLIAAGIEAVGIAENFVVEEELPATSV